MDRLQHIRHMLEGSPEDPFLRFALAKELEGLQVPEDALSAWNWFTENDPEYNGRYYHHARLLARMDRSEEALEVIRQGLEVTQRQGDRHAHGELRALQDEVED